MTTSHPRRVLMIGIDAGDSTFIRRFLTQLPNFRRLFEQGAFTPLRTTAEHLVGSVWPTFYTGSLPGEHGIQHPMQWDPESMRMRRVTEDWLYAEPFWYELARQGKKVAALDVPFVLSSRLKTGAEIINWGSHDRLGRFSVNSPTLRRELLRYFGRHPMGYEIPVEKSRKQLEAIRTSLIASAKLRGRASRWLMQREPWDFFLTVFGETHRGGHILWPRAAPDSRVPEGALLEVYRVVDQEIGEVLTAVDLDTTAAMVFALHGMREIYAQEQFVRPVLERVNDVFLNGTAPRENTPPDGGLIRKLRMAVPARVQHAVGLNVPVAIRDWVVRREVIGGLDWEKTPALSLRGDTFGALRLNLRGREKHGILEQDSDEHRRYTALLRESFEGLKDAATGRALTREVSPIHDLYPGPRSQYLPDLIINWAHRPPTSKALSPGLGPFSAPPATGRSGEHRALGFATFLGAWPEQSRAQPPKHIVELAGFLSRVLPAAA